MKFLKQHWLILLILALAVFVRLYRLPATLTFLEDEGRDLLMVKRMLDTKRPILLGPQTSTGNMYLGPLYYFIITPALALSGMNPLGPAALIALSGVLTVFLLYLFGTRWFGKSAGIMASLMYAVLPLPTFFTRNSWNPNLVPLISLLIAWAVIKLSSRKYQKIHYLYLGLLFGTLVQLHYMSLIYLVFSALIVFVPRLRKPRELLTGASLTLSGFALVLAPFIIFELRNNFVNTHALFKFIFARDDHAIRYSLPLWLFFSKLQLTSTKLFSGQFGRGGQALDPYASVITFSGVLLFFFGALTAYLKRHLSPVFRRYLILALLFFLPLLTLSIYQENIHLHYLGFFFPLSYLLIAGLTAFSRPARLLVVVLAAFSLCYSLPTTYNYLNSGATNQPLRAQEVALYISNRAGSDPYNVVSTEGYFTAPFQYYLSLVPNRPSNALAQRIFVICDGDYCSQEEETTVLLFLTGPSHPSLEAYLGHPQLNSFELPRTIVTNEHVSHGIWVAELRLLEKPPSP